MRRLAVAGLVPALLIAACSGSGSHQNQPAHDAASLGTPPPAPAPRITAVRKGDERVIRGWNKAMNAGDYGRAATFFAPGTVVPRTTPCSSPRTGSRPSGTRACPAGPTSRSSGPRAHHGGQLPPPRGAHPPVHDGRGRAGALHDPRRPDQDLAPASQHGSRAHPRSSSPRRPGAPPRRSLARVPSSTRRRSSVAAAGGHGARRALLAQLEPARVRRSSSRSCFSSPSAARA